ncbi:MAG: iron uptake porin [Cyanobacteria bacterium P01_G01_bin.39]
MLNLWRKINSVAILGASYLVFAVCTEVHANSLLANNNLNLHGQVNIEKSGRQQNLINDSIKKLPTSAHKNNNWIAQINQVKQLQNVSPTDWSYQALKDLIKRYGCVVKFSPQPATLAPEPSFMVKPQEAYISRAEFAVGLNTCLNRIESIIANSPNVPRSTVEDVELILQLMQEFQSDLAIFKGRIDGSQARVQDLEVSQFSTTSKLRGEAIFALGSILSGGDDSTVFGNRLRLEFATSLQGEDLLFTRLSASAFPGFTTETGTFQGSLSFAEDTGNDIGIDTLYYSFGVGDRLNIIVGAVGLEGDDIAPTINFLDGDGGSGSISTFGTRNPLYNPPGDAGLGITHSPIEQIKITAGYLAGDASDPSSGNGLFDGAYSVLGQIIITPLESLTFAATYVHSFNQSDTETGTNLANLQSFTADLFGDQLPTVNSSYGLEVSWELNSRIVIGGWGGLSKVSNLATLGQPIDRGTQDIWDWAATLALPDLGSEGSLGGIIIGSEPTVTNSSITNLDEDSDRSLHLEAFYQYQINDNISITPGVVWITEPDGDIQDADDLVIGTVRTTFSF